MKEILNNKKLVISHYDALIDENNDPFHDSKLLQDYMDKWDGPGFIEQMALDESKSVLEIGVGTGRLAIRVAPLCRELWGIDISPKTVERGRENLDSSLTFMHIEDKQKAMDKVAGLLNSAGRFVLSIDKNKSGIIDTGTRKIIVYPDRPDETAEYIRNAGLIILNRYDTELATIFTAVPEGGRNARCYCSHD